MSAESKKVTWTGGTEHWTSRSTADGEVKLFLWNKKANAAVPRKGTIFFVHGSSMAAQPTFDLAVAGRPWSSAMDWFANQGFDTWTMDNEGYGRSSKFRNINSDISNGADDIEAGSAYVMAVQEPANASFTTLFDRSADFAALLADPRPSTWEDAHGVVINAQGLTLWQAWIAIDLTAPHTGRHVTLDPFDEVIVLREWDRIPDEAMLSRAIAFALRTDDAD